MTNKDLIQKCINFSENTGKIPSRAVLQHEFGISENLARCIKFFIENKQASEEITIKSKEERRINKTLQGPNYDIVCTSSDIRTLEELLAFCKIDLDKWQVDKHIINSWGSDVNENFQVKAWLKEKNPNSLSIEEQADQFKEFIKEYKPNWDKLESLKRNESDLMMEISLPDFHYGLLAWAKESDDDYDIEIASKLWLDAIIYFANIAKNYNVEKILFPLGSDFFNSDNALNTTFKGTPQSEDSRFQKTFSTGWMLVVQSINILLNVADVELVIISGNHDRTLSFYMGEVLNAYYKDCKNVNIDNRPLLRKYFKYGKNLIGQTHGNNEKLADLPGIMFIEAKEYISECENFEIHIGHWHTEKGYIKEFVDQQAVKVRVMPCISAKSDYSKSKGYLSVRKGVALLWDKEKGNIADFYYYPEKEIE